MNKQIVIFTMLSFFGFVQCQNNFVAVSKKEVFNNLIYGNDKPAIYNANIYFEKEYLSIVLRWVAPKKIKTPTGFHQSRTETMQPRWGRKFCSTLT